MTALCFLSIMLLSAAVPTRAVASKPDPLAHSNQLIVVTTPSWATVAGQLQRYERRNENEPWHSVDRSIPVVVGRNGLGWGIGVVATDTPTVRTDSDPVKHEGDGKAPAGVFTLGPAFGYAPQPLQGFKLPYQALAASIECVDDVDSKHYNRLVDRSTVIPDWKSSEAMRGAGEAYRWGIVVDHNGTAATAIDTPPTPGKGSCIFLHIWKSAKQGTAGCTAMPQVELESLLTWIDPKRKPLLVQLPAHEYERLAQRWRLPKAPAASVH